MISAQAARLEAELERYKNAPTKSESRMRVATYVKEKELEEPFNETNRPRVGIVHLSPNFAQISPACSLQPTRRGAPKERVSGRRFRRLRRYLQPNPFHNNASKPACCAVS